MLPTAERFANRADNYSKYRPGYPSTIISFLQEKIGLNSAFRVADIGAGTGIFSALFLQEGSHVTVVEPNAEMRHKAEKFLADFAGVTIVDGDSANTGLADGSVDLVTVAQAFHWMEPAAAKKEFLRILKPGGHILLAWNIRLDDSPFLKAYEGLRLKYGGDYHKQRKEVDAESLTAFFSPMQMFTHTVTHSQWLDYKSFEGLFLSSSFIPINDYELVESMKADLLQLFMVYKKNGALEIQYETKLYFNE